jgi:hypothetical protein
MCIIFQSHVRKLTGKPAFLTIADCESEARRIHLTGVRHRQQRIPNPHRLVLVRRFDRSLNRFVFNLVYASAQHDSPNLGRRQLGAAHLFYFCHTICVDIEYFLSYAKSTIKIDMVNLLKTEKKVLAVSMLAEGTASDLLNV